MELFWTYGSTRPVVYATQFCLESVCVCGWKRPIRKDVIKKCIKEISSRFLCIFIIFNIKRLIYTTLSICLYVVFFKYCRNVNVLTFACVNFFLVYLLYNMIKKLKYLYFTILCSSKILNRFDKSFPSLWLICLVETIFPCLQIGL